MDKIIESAARIMFPISLMLGAYIAFHGHLTPGGGFPAGVVMGTSMVMIMLAMGHLGRKTYRDWRMNFLKVLAGVVFICVIVLGLYFRGALLESQTVFSLWSGGFTILANLLGSMMVAIALIGAFYYLTEEAG
jgi:multicomponent Na+:H+ antiporter subunit B